MGVDRPSTKRVGGSDVTLPIGMLKYGNMVIALYRHPLLMIPYSITAWEREYRYSGDHYRAVPYINGRHPCAIEALEVYETALLEFKQENRGP